MTFDSAIQEESGDKRPETRDAEFGFVAGWMW